MGNKKSALIKYLSLVGLVVWLAACTAQPVVPGTGGTPSLQPTLPVSTALPATSQPLAGATPVQPGGEPTATTSMERVTPEATVPAGGDLQVTLADQGKTIALKVGQRFLLNLGSEYEWSPTVADQSIVSRVVGIMVIRGAQGIYEARAPGTTKLTASGDPACRQSKPACAMPSRLFEVTIVVAK